MEIMVSILKLNFQLPEADDYKLYTCKGECLRCILLYSQKYREEFEELIQVFSSQIWQTCLNATEDKKFDKIVLNSLKYFKTLMFCPSNKEIMLLNLPGIVDTLILPNIKITRKIIDFSIP